MQKKVFINKALLTFALLSAPVATHAMQVSTEPVSEINSTKDLGILLVKCFPFLGKSEQTELEALTILFEKARQTDSSLLEACQIYEFHVLIGKLMLSESSRNQLFAATLSKQYTKHTKSEKAEQKKSQPIVITDAELNKQLLVLFPFLTSEDQEMAELLETVQVTTKRDQLLLQSCIEEDIHGLMGKLVLSRDSKTKALAVKLAKKYADSAKQKNNGAHSSPSETATRESRSTSMEDAGKDGSKEATQSTEKDTPGAEKENANTTIKSGGLSFTSVVVIAALVCTAGYFINKHIKEQQNN